MGGGPYLQTRGPARVVRFDRATGTCEIEFAQTTLHTGYGQKVPEQPARIRYTRARDVELQELKPPRQLSTGERVMEGHCWVVLRDGTRIPCVVVCTTGEAGQVTGILDSEP